MSIEGLKALGDLFLMGSIFVGIITFVVVNVRYKP